MRLAAPPPLLEDVVERVQAHRGDLERLGVRSLAVFGSVARGDARPDSDVDMLVDYTGSIFKAFNDIEEYLVDLFGRKVDLVPRDAVKPQLKPRIEAEAIEILPEFQPRSEMPPKQPREWRMYVEDMVEAGERILGSLQGKSVAQLAADIDTLEAVAWRFQILGEAVTNLPAEKRAGHPEVPWVEIRAMRNKIVHGYWTIDPNLVWDVATRQLAPVLDQLRTLLAAES